ncbi:MAG: hypothetical protein M3Y22_04345 [Pseudomonadota bacterium]|nr:hypothetical protein [Pseudomonadota bacterium]
MSMPLERRLAVLTSVALAHFGLLIALLPRAPPTPPVTASQQSGGGAMLTLYSLSRTPSAPSAVVIPPAPADTPAPTPVAQADPDEPIAHPEDLGLPPPSIDTAPDPLNDDADQKTVASLSLPGLPGTNCNLGALLQASLQANPRVAAALALIPRQSRSVANAIMLWNEGWIDVPSPSGDTAMAPLRAAIVQTIQDAPADCRDAMNLGPILVPLVEADGATVLALGSGSWRARELSAKSSVGLAIPFQPPAR